jgi:arylsulfatase A-like enzyme
MTGSFRATMWGVLAIGIAAGACRDSPGGGSAGAGAQGPRGSAGNAGPARRSVRATRTALRSLLAEADRAELHAGGLFVDLGSLDQHKYTRGGWRSGWGAATVDDTGVSLAPITEATAALDVNLVARLHEVVVRARAPRGATTVSCYVDGQALDTVALEPEWATQVCRLPAGVTIEAGRHSFELRFAKAAKGPSAEVDWVWLRTDTTTAEVVPLPRLMPIRLGDKTRRALAVPSARTYAFYLQPPAHGTLVFDYGADRALEFSVQVAADGAEPEQIFSAVATANEWIEAEVDLSTWGNRAVRVDLVASGEPALAGWGEPEVMVARSAQEPAVPAPVAAPKNLIVLVMDTARADVFKPFNPGSRLIAPAMDRFVAQGTKFLRAYNADNWTKPSVATILTGLYPTTHTAERVPSVVPADVELLSEVMKGHKLATGGFVANVFVSEAFGFLQGWDHYVNYIDEKRPSEARFVFRDAIKWIEDQEGEPFFAYIQTIDPHVDYRVDREFSQLYYPGAYTGPVGPSLSGVEQAAISRGTMAATEDDLDWIRALYSGEVSYHDRHFGLFLEQLETLGLVDNTLVIVTNDHGEELNDHGHLGHGHSLYEELLRAPLAIRYPGLFPAGKQIDEVVEQVDLFATILEVMDLPARDSDGLSLMPLVRGEPYQRPRYAVSEYRTGKRSIRVDGWKMIRSANGNASLYDLDADPGEQNDLAKTHPIARALCDVYLGEALANLDKSTRFVSSGAGRKFKAGEAKIDPELHRQLEALGYFGEQ